MFALVSRWNEARLRKKEVKAKKLVNFAATKDKAMVAARAEIRRLTNNASRVTSILIHEKYSSGERTTHTVSVEESPTGGFKVFTRRF